MSEFATFAMGGFWSSQAVFRFLSGVIDVRIGYMALPSVGAPNRAQRAERVEVVQIEFDPEAIPYDPILDRFWLCHDGTAAHDLPENLEAARLYSIIFCHTSDQALRAEQSIRDMQARHQSPLCTIASPVTDFFPAHHNDQHRLELGGAFAYVHLSGAPKHVNGPVLAFESPHGPGPLEEEFGGLFGYGGCSEPCIRHFLLDNEGHLERITNQIRTWIGGLNDPENLARATALADVGSAMSSVVVSTSTDQLWAIVNLQPGSFRPRPGVLVNRSYTYRIWTPGEHEPQFANLQVGQLSRPMAVETDMRLTVRPPQSDGAELASWIPDATFKLPCPHGHLVRWRVGELTLLHNSREVLQSERSLLALGSDRCICLRLIEAWDVEWWSSCWPTQGLTSFEWLLEDWLARPKVGSPADDGILYASCDGAVGLSDIQLPSPSDRPDPNDYFHYARTIGSVAQNVFGLMGTMEPGIQTRWLSDGLRTLLDSRRSLDSAQRNLVASSIFAALRTSVGSSLWQFHRPNASVECAFVHCRLVEKSEEIAAEGYVDNGVVHVLVAVTYEWFRSVWLKSLAVVDGCLVLDVAELRGEYLVATIAKWSPSDTLKLETERCSLVWSGEKWQRHDGRVLD